MNVGVVGLLGQVVCAQNLIESAKKTAFAIGRRFIETFFVVGNELRSVWRGNKVELTVLVNSFGRTEPERFVFNDGAAGSSVIIPTQQIRHVFAGNVRAIEH